MINKPISIFKPYVSEKAIERVVTALRSGWIGEGLQTQELERRIGNMVKSPFSVSVNSGTSALHLALLVAGVKPGDQVVTTAQTMLATTQAILVTGAEPVFADINYEDGNLDHRDIKKRITSKTKAILTVDWGGYPCDYNEIASIAEANNIIVIEDAAHALGAVYDGKPVGSLCPFTCFSFQAIKHLTTGDGGMICMKDKESHQKAIRLRWFGIDRFQRKPSVLGEPEWNVTELGYKYHMNDIAASIGLGNLDEWDWILGRRKEIAGIYRSELASVAGVTLFERKKDRQSADWLFSMHVERRTDFCKAVLDRGVSASVVHLRIDRNGILGKKRDDLTQLARFTETHVSLPLHPLLKDEEVMQVVSAVRTGW